MMENRLYKRFRRSLKVTWKQEAFTFESVTRDICAGGVFIITSHSISPREVIELELTSEDHEPPMRCYGRVIWVNQGQVESFPPGFGVELLGFDDLVLDRILNFCDTLQS